MDVGRINCKSRPPGGGQWMIQNTWKIKCIACPNQGAEWGEQGLPSNLTSFRDNIPSYILACHSAERQN